MTTTSTVPTPSTTRRTSSYGDHQAAVLLATFALSVTHTVYGYVAGIGDPGFTVTTPVTYVFYAVGFAAAALARSRRRWVDLALPAYLVALLGISVLYYPSTFGPEQQTVFGWVENDLYVGGLVVALYLGVLRLRGTRLA